VKRIEKNPRDFTSDCWQTYINHAGIAGSDCVLSLPPSIARHQILRLPNMNVQELKEAATWEMADRLGVERSTLQIDAIPVGSGGDVLAIAIDQQVLASLLDPLYSSGLRPTAVEPQCISITRALSMRHRRQSDQSITRSVFDFGMHESAFMVLSGDTLVFYKHLDHCGKQLLDAIAVHTDVTFEQAERMLFCSQEEPDIDITKAVRDATRATHEAIATDAMKCIRHYGVANRGPLSTHIIVTGNVGWNVHLANVLTSSCSQEVVSDTDIPHIQSLPKDIVQTNGWHAALGASLACMYRHRRLSDSTGREAA
jgi:Tfp pilus assembly PilM family ATPase